MGLGALSIGGGALLGSGAFSSTEAQRGVEINVVADEDLPVDVLVRTSQFNSVAVTEDGADEEDLPSDSDDAGELFPTGADYDDIGGFTSEAEDVSLIANDVRLIFGPEGYQLPPNARVTYDQLLVVVNPIPDGESYTVTLETEGEVFDELVYRNEGQETATLAGGSTENVDAEIQTEEDGRVSDGELTIRIERA